MSLTAVAARFRAEEIRKKYHYGINCKNCKEYIKIINAIFDAQCVDVTGVDITDFLLDEYDDIITSISTGGGATTCVSGVISVSDLISCVGADGDIYFLDESNITVVDTGGAPVVSEDVITVVVDGTNTLILPVDTLLQVVVLTSTITGNAFIGTTLGGTEVISTSVTAGTPSVWTLNYYYPSGVNLFFTGNFTAKLYIA